MAIRLTIVVLAAIAVLMLVGLLYALNIGSPY